MSDRYFCDDCNYWHIGLGIEDPHYSTEDNEPCEIIYLGINGCRHSHLMPNVTPSGCSYCGSTE